MINGKINDNNSSKMTVDNEGKLRERSPCGLRVRAEAESEAFDICGSPKAEFIFWEGFTFYVAFCLADCSPARDRKKDYGGEERRASIWESRVNRKTEGRITSW